MAYANSALITGVGTTSITTAAKNMSAANYLVAFAACGATQTPTISDSSSNTWTAQTVRTINGATKLQVWTCQAATTSASQTFTFGQGVADILIGGVIGLSGRATTSALEAIVYGVDASAVTSHTAGATGAITAGDDVVFVFSDDNSTVRGVSDTYTAGSGWTLDVNQADGRTTMTGGFEYQTNVGTGSLTGTITSSASVILGGYVMAIKAGAGGGGIAVGGSGSVGSGTAVSSLTTSATTTQVSGSSFLLCAAYSVSGSITSVSDNKSNFYTAIGPEIANPTDGRFMRLFVFASGTGGSAHTCTVNFSTAQAGTAIFVEVTGAAATNIVDALTVILAGGGSPYACPLVTNASTDLLVGFISSAVTGAESFSSSVLTNSITQFTNATSGFGAGGALSGVASGAARYDPAIADTASFARALIAVVAIKQSGATSTDSLLGQISL